MTTNHQCFSLRRLGFLMRNDVLLSRSMIVTVMLTIAGVLLLFNLLAPHNVMTIHYHPTGFCWLLFIGGIWVTGMAFKNVHNKNSSYFYLTLPASQFEKLLSRLILTAIIYPMAILVFYTLFYWIIAGIDFLFFRSFSFIQTPFLEATWRIIATYVVIQSIFFLGSVYFKRHSIIKTVLTLSIIGIILSLFILILSALFLHGSSLDELFWLPNFSASGTVLLNTIKILFWAVITPVCWVVAYVRFKEIEVK